MGKLIRFRRKGKKEDGKSRPLFPPFRSGAGGTDARPKNWLPSDASPLQDPSRAPDADVIERRRKRVRRTVVVALWSIFLGGIAASIFGERGYLDVTRLRARQRAMKQESEEHLKRFQALKRDVDRLRTDPASVERIAREELGYVAPGEVTLLLPGEDPVEPHRLDPK